VGKRNRKTILEFLATSRRGSSVELGCPILDDQRSTTGAETFECPIRPVSAGLAPLSHVLLTVLASIVAAWLLLSARPAVAPDDWQFARDRAAVRAGHLPIGLFAAIGTVENVDAVTAADPIASPPPGLPRVVSPLDVPARGFRRGGTL
jgi:hypothetical protein